MAVDSADRRASAIGIGLAALLVLPAPGSIDQPDRQHVAYSYRGIEAGSPVPPIEALAIQITVAAEDRAIHVQAEDRTIIIEAVGL